MENWFKIGIIVVGLLVLFCLLSLISKQGKAEQLSNNIKCNEQAQKYVAQGGGIFMSGDRSTYESKFVKKLNTCIVKVTSIGSSLDLTIEHIRKSITDVYANKELATYMITNSSGQKIEMTGDSKLFNELDSKYFK